MKKAFLILVGALFCALSCQPYDDTELKEMLQEHEIRLKKLEVTCKLMNTNISSVGKILQTLQNDDYITAINPINNDGAKGYELVFKKAGKITIYDGKDGLDGKDASYPQISVKKDSDGHWYWTLDNEFVTVDGQKVRADAVDGKDGADGMTPTLKIENDEWFVQYGPDGEWISFGTAIGPAGQAGQNSYGPQGPQGLYGPQGPQGEKGEPGKSFFKDLAVKDGNCTLTLADGQTIIIPVITDKLSVSVNPKTCVASAPGEETTIGFTITGSELEPEAKVFTTNGWKARIASSTKTGGQLVITAPDSRQSGEVTLLVGNGKSNTVMVKIPCSFQ